MANPRRTEPLRAVSAPEPTAPQPVYFQIPDDGITRLIGGGLMAMAFLGTALGVFIGWGVLLVLLGVRDGFAQLVLNLVLSFGTFAYLARHWLSARFPTQYGAVVDKLKEWS